MGRETVYVCYQTLRRFSKADEMGMQTNPERGTIQQASYVLEEESKMSASRFLLPIVYP